MVVGPARDELVVLDTATDRVVHRVGLHREPDQIVYTQEFAYIRHRGTEQVVLIPLAELGRRAWTSPSLNSRRARYSDLAGTAGRDRPRRHRPGAGNECGAGRELGRHGDLFL